MLPIGNVYLFAERLYGLGSKTQISYIARLKKTPDYYILSADNWNLVPDYLVKGKWKFHESNQNRWKFKVMAFGLKYYFSFAV